MSLLPAIVVACLAGGLLSLLLAAQLAFRLPSAGLGRMVAFAAGTMLAAALLDILPEAFSLAPRDHDALFATLLVALLAFYLLERAALWRHAHPDAASHEAHAAHPAPSQGAAWVVLLGDGVHNFVDGVLIAAAFLADPWLGVTTTLAVVAHEVPQELGDFVLLMSAGWSKRKALLANAASNLGSVLGGVLGWLALDGARGALPYALAVAAASFLYIAVADLLPLLHQRRHIDGFVPQSALLAAGLICIPLVGHWLH
jgi:zinc and cadmium transporter